MTTEKLRIVRSSAFVCYSHELPKDFDKFKLIDFPHLDQWNSSLNKLIKMGFRITVDERIKKQYPILSPYHKYGIWQELEVNIEIYPTGFRFEFYQNINTGDRNVGYGYYVFDKYKLMPYLCKKRFELVCKKLIKHLNIPVEYQDTPKLAEAAVISHKATSWHNKTPVNSLDDFQYQLSEYDINHNSFDREKKIIKCGEVKYFRNRWTGRLERGYVYHNINNMWWVITSKFSYSNIGSFELFDATDIDFKVRRKKKGSMPESKKKEIEFLNNISTGKLNFLIKRKSKMKS